MAKDIIYLTLEQILVIHEDQIALYGGTSGLRDLSLLESALFRPQTSFADNDLYKTLFDKAATLWHSLILNHPFLDGNKRTGTVAMLVFLLINGWTVEVSKKELVQAALKIEAKKSTLQEIAQWIKKHARKS